MYVLVTAYREEVSPGCWLELEIDAKNLHVYGIDQPRKTPLTELVRLRPWF